MNPKEIAAHYEAKVFDTPEAATGAGFTLTETMAPRNVWNKASAAQSLALKLRDKKDKGEAKEIGHGYAAFFVASRTAQSNSSRVNGFGRTFPTCSR